MNALLEGVHAVQDEAAGVLNVCIVRPCDRLTLIEAALDGDLDAFRLTAVVFQAADQMRRMPTHKPALCSCCPRRLRDGFAIVAAFANRDDPSAAVTFGICQRCGPDLPAIQTNAGDALRKLWPNARTLAMSHWHEGGRA